MRFKSLILAGILFLLPMTGLEAQEAPRLGFIDSQAIINEAPGAREAQAEFREEMERFQREMERMEGELGQLVNRYQQQRQTLSPEAREQRENEIRRMEQDFQQRVDQMEEEAVQRREELVGPILARMSETIEEIRTEGNYTMIFDVAAQAIVAADPELDLTSEVIRRLRQMAERGDR
jgi:outer membrane protein